ncbi:DUF190 domain-containing protein [Fervidobacterium thailandense]|uniref:Uncharacterized protein n=1 Tax=Fervidobacterium thailandense TaxID=1008305 RepID=A0A1E3G2Q5_9BACT|nr:DUF190 domain-containing protein [Fervidobacterium thailandense]ODN30430.1 hypothetical protein A4H02_05195 [Fervidobacterium thailandense]
MYEFEGTYIKIFVRENEKCKALHNKPLNRVIAEIAIELGISDFVEYKAMEGYIFDRKLHTSLREVVEPSLPIIIEVFTTDELAQKFLERIHPYLRNAAVLVFKEVRGIFYRGDI